MKKRLFAGFAALCMAASLASAAFAETATPETARVASPQVVEYQASDDDTGFSASAEAAPGVLPDGAELTVAPLDETAAPKEVIDYGERAAALDLTFKDTQGAEVEPDGGTVKVTIQLPSEITAELQQAQELTLVHRAEQDGTITPEKVESAVFADGCTQVSFETNSFSVYEIYATVPQDADSARGNQVDTYVGNNYKKYNGVAAIYYLASPTFDASSNETNQWKPDADESTDLGRINTYGATWDRIQDGTGLWGRPEYKDKNITKDVSKYITSWPDGSTEKEWTVTRNDSKTGNYFKTILTAIWDEYKESIRKETGVGNLEMGDVTQITLIPFKISRDNGGAYPYHIDCTISVKCSKVFTAKFWVKEPGATDYNTVPLDAKSYAQGSQVEKTTKQVDTTKVVNGVTYVLTGWYAENDATHGAKGNLIPDDSWPYAPTDTQLKDGTVNFYAEYVPACKEVTVTKTVTGTLGDKTKDFSFTLNVTNNGSAVSENITGTKAKQGGGTDELSISENNGTFTLKHGESVTFNIPYGANVTVTESDYTQKTGDATPYTTSYIVDNGNKQTGLEATISNVTADHTIAFTNDKEAIPDTGITLNSMPYLLVLAGVLVGGLAWMRRRKRS